jgi:PhnB protein
MSAMTTSNPNTAVQPYLFFGGHCEEALEFYRETLGAEVQMLMRFKDSPEPSGLPDCFNDKIMHSCVRIGATTFMASDGRCEGPPAFEGFSLSITVPDDGDAERVFNALSEKGTVVMPLEKTFWTSKFGMLEDRFGLSWMVSVQSAQS